jgi:hypothetical protein
MAAHRLDLRDRLKPWCRRFDPVPAHLLPHHVDECRNPTLLWPTIFMAADPVPPARSRFRTAVRRKVVGNPVRHTGRLVAEAPCVPC